MEFPVFQFVPIASCPIGEHHGDESGSILFTKHPPPQSGIYKHG